MHYRGLNDLEQGSEVYYTIVIITNPMEWYLSLFRLVARAANGAYHLLIKEQRVLKSVPRLIIGFAGSFKVHIRRGWVLTLDPKPENLNPKP